MKNRYFSGIPHTETAINAFESAIATRAADSASGKFAAADFVEAAVDRVAKRSLALLQANTLFAIVTLLLTFRAAELPATYVQLNRWAFIFSLVSGFLLITNLALVWARDALKTYTDPHEAFAFSLSVYKGRAWRYTIALVLSFVAFALTLLSLTQLN